MNKCGHCEFEAKTPAGLSAHHRIKHTGLPITSDPIAEDMIRDQANRDRLNKKRKTADSFNNKKVYAKDT